MSSSPKRPQDDDIPLSANLIKQSMENWECSWDEACERLVEAINWQRAQRKAKEAGKKAPKDQS